LENFRTLVLRQLVDRDTSLANDSIEALTRIFQFYHLFCLQTRNEGAKF